MQLYNEKAFLLIHLIWIMEQIPPTFLTYFFHRVWSWPEQVREGKAGFGQGEGEIRNLEVDELGWGGNCSLMTEVGILSTVTDKSTGWLKRGVSDRTPPVWRDNSYRTRGYICLSSLAPEWTADTESLTTAGTLLHRSTRCSNLTQG